jgi:hypothetical protein
MAQFNYTLPSGAQFTMEAPAGTTQDRADYIFYSQVAAGALVGFVPGQSIQGGTATLVKFELSRLDRGTAGVDDSVILSIVNGLATVNTATNTIPSLINTPLTNPVTRASISAVVSGSRTAGSGFTAPAIGALSSDQTLALMAQVADLVNQPACQMTNEKGVGQYGLNCQQLEQAGYVKPNTYQQFLQNGSSTLVDALSAPGIWTGLGGISSSDDFLNNPSAQNTAQAALMNNSYNSLQAAGVITTPTAQGLSAVVGQVYTGTTATQTAATVTNIVNSQVAALVTNSSQYGTQLASQWASGLPPVTNLTSNLTGIVGQLGTVSLASAQDAMNVLGKASQFASSAASPLSNLSLSSLSNLSVSGVADKLGASATALAGQIQGQITGQAAALAGQATALAGQLQVQAGALVKQAQGQLNSLLGQADSLVASVQQAAGFTNTVNRATVDVAMTKIFGSAKIPTPSFGVPDSASIAAALDISKAQAIVKNLQGQATGLVNQAQGLVNQAQGQANNLIDTAKNAVNLRV